MHASQRTANTYFYYLFTVSNLGLRTLKALHNQIARALANAQVYEDLGSRYVFHSPSGEHGRAVRPHIIVCFCSGSAPGPGPAPLCRGRSVQLSGRPPPCVPLTHPTPLQSRGSKGLPGTSYQGLEIPRDKDVYV